MSTRAAPTDVNVLKACTGLTENAKVSVTTKTKIVSFALRLSQ